MTNILELAERVEALDGRNNDGDMTIVTGEIARALGWYRVTPSEAKNKHGHWIAPEDCRDGEPVYDSLHGTTCHRNPPNWLWSLDAAMKLMPEGWFASINTGRVNIVVLTGRSDDPIVAPVDVESTANTAALALVAASLRAIAEEETE